MPGERKPTPLGRADFTALVAAVTAAVAEAVRPVPELLDATQAREYVGLSKTGWHRAKSAGKLPAAVHVAGSGDRWRKRDLDRWVERLTARRKFRRDDAEPDREA